MDMKLFDGDICTPQGFIIDTFECYLNGLISYISVLIADNPCTVAFKYPENLENVNISNIHSLESTKGIAQAIIINVSNNVFFKYDEDFNKCISNQLGLYDENFLLNFVLNNLNELDSKITFAIQFNICGVVCNLGILKYHGVIYITTDVAITHDMIDLALNDIYYKINIKDIFCVMASGKAGNMAITKCNYNFNTFKKALNFVVMNLY